MTNNRHVARRMIAAALALFVPVGALCAPLVHAHLEDHHSSHHAGRLVHAHASGHAIAPFTGGTTAGAVLSDETERTLALQLFLAVRTPGVALPALCAQPFVLASPLTSAEPRAPSVTHGHDPPLAGLLPSRAPPA